MTLQRMHIHKGGHGREGRFARNGKQESPCTQDPSVPGSMPKEVLGWLSVLFLLFSSNVKLLLKSKKKAPDCLLFLSCQQVVRWVQALADGLLNSD